MNFQILFCLSLCFSRVKAKAAFAHFLVGNTFSFVLGDWENDISLAKAAHIDAFALNVAANDPVNAAQLPLAFQAAQSLGFQLFFSFDYAGNGPWASADVISTINTYAPLSSYFHFNGKPFVSTFEGAANAGDWKSIKAATSCYFLPDWSSMGPQNALSAGAGVVDGLFNWQAWPWGNTDMNTYEDGMYGQFLDSSFGGDGTDFSHYMMGVSPWFFTNLPGYDKNWLWRGDSLWYDRWQQIMYLQPEFVEIITWNDFGESHYIGPLNTKEYGLFGSSAGGAPYNYALSMPHDGWRALLPYLIDTYKNNVSTVTQEALVAWYRPNPVAGSTCSTGDTSGNTHSQFQVEFEPGQVVQDNIFYSALLGSDNGVTVTVSIGSTTQVGTFAHKPLDGIGIYHGNVSMNGHTGPVTITLSRGGASISGAPITTTCTDGIQNWNAWVGSATGLAVSATPSLKTNQKVCIAGTANGPGAANYVGLCEFTCSYGYCPLGTCLCTQMGKQKTLPPSTGIQGYPVTGEGSNFLGLCSFACNFGYCPTGVCGTTKEPLTEPTISPFFPLACTAGSGQGDLTGLCSFACSYGFCPIVACACTSEGALGTLPTNTGTVGTAFPGKDVAVYGDICAFTCRYGYCPSPPCQNKTASPSPPPTTSNVCISGSGQGNFGGLCSFSCNFGFCPQPCTCTAMGAHVPLPTATGVKGVPLPGEDSTYGPLCRFACNLGYCPSTACAKA